MSPQNQEKQKTKYILQDRTNLTLLVLILGILSVISIGILLLSFVRQLYPLGFAAINKQLNYQGKLQDADGITVPDGSYNMKFTIYDAASGGNILWTARETDACGAPFNPDTKSINVSSGVFSTLLGESGDCPITLDFNSDAYYLGVTVGTDSEMTPRKRIGAAGYAFNADLLDGVSEEYFAQLAENEMVTGSWEFNGLNTAFGNANTDTVTFTAYINSDLYVGANAETLSNAGFTMTGAGAGFFADELGVEGSIYTDTSFIVGASTTYGDGTITTSGTTDLIINPDGGDVFIADDNLIVDTNTLYVDAITNQVGIGTAPSYTLDVRTSVDDRAIFGLNSKSGTAYGVYGYALNSDALSANYGGYFVAEGGSGRGVAGVAAYSATNTTNYGGYFIAAGQTGIGVYGEATYNSTATINYGGYFTAAGKGTGSIGNATAGVYGEATSSAAIINYGGLFKTAGIGSGASGVYGEGTNTGYVQNYGGYFVAKGQLGRAVYGLADNTANQANYGGYFVAQGSGGRGVYGEANSASSSNYGGYFIARGGGDSTAAVRGEATYNTGATTNYGGYFIAQGYSGIAVYGWATHSTGTNYGGYFLTAGGSNSRAVFGNATNTGAANTGGYFIAAGTANSAAVYGEASNGGPVINYGGYFLANGSEGRGVYARATNIGAGQNFGGYFTAEGAGNDTAGVYGRATGGSARNYGGYFSAAGTTAGTSGVFGQVTSYADNVYGVYGEAYVPGNYQNYGGYFLARGFTGRGVYGEASYTGASANYGGYFKAAGDNGVGVYGEASDAGAVTNYGGYFTSAGGGGRGVYGAATYNSTATINYGGYFTAAGTGTGSAGNATAGVYGEATSSAAIINYGGLFKTAGIGSGASGVYGEGTNTGYVQNYGGYFVAKGQVGRGVYGEANYTGASANYGGYFIAGGSDAGTAGVFGEAVNTGTTGPTYGGNFATYGTAVGTAGVFGAAVNAGATGSTYGGYFKTNGTITGAAGVYAEATGAADYIIGVYGKASNSGNYNTVGGYFESLGTGLEARGVIGQSINGAGVRGEATGTGAVSNYGGYFSAAGNTGYGVKSEATTTGAVSNYGGYFEAKGDTGYGVYGYASASSGTNYGVYGQVNSSTGWAGYFTGGYGLYASQLSIADTTPPAYNTIGTAAASHTAPGEIEDTSDLFIADDLEVDGYTWLDGGHTDIAEMIAFTGTGEAGDVIVIDENNNNTAKLATKPYDQNVIGVISTKPSLIITGNIKEGKLLAVAGRIPTKVTNENGPIQRGDLLTTSGKPGHAMKATKPGPIVGKALEPCNQNSCAILVFLNVGWYGGTNTVTEIKSPPSLPIASQITLDKLTTDLDANNFSIINVKKIASADEVWSIDENGVLKIKIQTDFSQSNDATLVAVKEIFGLSSTEVEIILSGSGKLEKGEALVDLALYDKEFLQIIDPEIPLKIIVTPQEETLGLYVAEKYPQGFKVKESNGGTSDASFDWIVIGRRAGYGSNE